ncbi:hypothetical protein [Erwinia persicina]|uniref:hypothetical protein n=1 Tax=Erwinia persicina TaxID=55211 RepID=UPI001787350C|nr:hypothetical protein [Erwinia persicina]MBD8162479.1 hypothetical protein [Erwinia persicina]MBD8214877.1 hypothetical protein [Erwinia persicina]
MNKNFLKKTVNFGISMMISVRNTPLELTSALVNILPPPQCRPYISSKVMKRLQQESDVLMPKEWAVSNLIHQGDSPSEIVAKKCRALSTISTQKRNATNMLHVNNENELLRDLQQQAFLSV